MKKMMFVLLVVALFFATACNSDPTGKYDLAGVNVIAFKDVDSLCETPELAKIGGDMLREVESGGTLLLSLVMDSTIGIEKNELAGHDHMVFTNPEWIERFGDESCLVKLAFDDLPVATREFLEVEMPVITADGSVCPEGVSFYEYKGGELLCYPTNVGYGNVVIRAKNPLIVMIDEPAEVMSAAGFMLPLSSSGNVMFTDENALNNAIANNGLTDYVLELRPATFK